MIYGQPIRTVAPTALPVSLPELKAHLRIDGNDEDAVLARYLAAATAKVEQYTGLGLLLQTWTQTFSEFADTLVLKRRPLLAVGSPAAAASVSYLDGTGTLQALDASNYRVTGIGADYAPGAIKKAFGATWPTTYDDPEAVTVTYTVGYGTGASSVPPQIIQAIYQTVGDWYAWREDVSTENFDLLPWSSESLLHDWRPVAIA